MMTRRADLQLNVTTESLEAWFSEMFCFSEIKE